MNEKFNDRLSHTTLGTDWDQTKRKYIAKIGDRYFYTQEQLRAFGQRAGKSAQGLGIRAKNDVLEKLRAEIQSLLVAIIERQLRMQSKLELALQEVM